MILQATHEKTGSVGAAWPPRYDAHNNRIKGFCTRPIGSMEDARIMFREVQDAQRAAPQATRTTVRAFVESGLVEGLRRETPMAMEASFDAGNAVEGHSVAYFGSTSPSRVPPAEVTERELVSVKAIQKLKKTDWFQAATRITAGGYGINRLNGDG
ncbi:MAG: hypothetical protein V1861_04780, partial [Candidatus Micrarchaeota archaeon]